MLKRGHPFTPEPAAAAGVKKNREYSSPLNRTPLRNVLPSGKSALAEEARNPPHTPLNDDVRERRAHRAAIAQSRRQMKKNLLSPAVKTTPKANPPTRVTPRTGGTPLTPSAIRVETAKPVAAPALTAEQRNKMFEEWMKIAADNKINAKNSWNVSLIDYFSELTFLRDGDSINFQKASCTLDGCVKIYSTRVDSVADETGKLLSGLADGKSMSVTSHGITLSLLEAKLEHLVESNASLEHEEERKLRSSKRPHRAMDTLERSFDVLNLKNFELEFSIDPLFKKMCTEFDESGTKGFLTSSLNLTAEGKLLLDSHTPLLLGEAESTSAPEAEILVDISGVLPSFAQQIAAINGRSIAPSLRDYSFSRTLEATRMDRQLAATLSRLAALSTTESSHLAMESGEESSADEAEAEAEAEVEFELPEEQIPLDDGMYEYYDEAPLPEVGVLPDVVRGEEQRESTREYGLGTDTTSSFLAYFDSQLQRNWAGPEHWRIRRPQLLRRPLAEAPRPRQAKKEFTLDFEAAPVDISTIFVKGNPATITLSRTMLDERREKDHLLPEDLHYSSSELLHLFINPAWTIGRKRERVVTTSQHETMTVRPDLESQEVEPSFWADAKNLEASHLKPTKDEAIPPLNDDYDDDYYDEPPVPDVPSPHHPLDDPCPPMALSSAGKDTMVDLVPTFRPATAAAVHYARKAKKVDVQELKRALWSTISDVSDGRASASAGQPRSFAQVIQDLSRSNISRETLQDVSVSYCFICLLHLANEHNLHLESPSGDLLISQPSQ